MIKKQRGFTLIELLVVIAIIGILSSVVLASLNVARSRGADAKVKAQIAGARSSAELYFDTNASYNGSAGDVASDCTTADSMFQDSASGMIQYTDAATNYPVGTTIRCSSSDNSFVISASLTNNNGGADPDFWCVDGTGTSQIIEGADHATAHPDSATTCS